MYCHACGAETDIGTSIAGPDGVLCHDCAAEWPRDAESLRDTRE